MSESPGPWMHFSQVLFRGCFWEEDLVREQGLNCDEGAMQNSRDRQGQDLCPSAAEPQPSCMTLVYNSGFG